MSDEIQYILSLTPDSRFVRNIRSVFTFSSGVAKTYFGQYPLRLEIAVNHYHSCKNK